MAGVGDDGPDRFLFAIETISVEALGLVPENGVEVGEEGVGLGGQAGGGDAVAAGGVELGHAAPGGVDVALELAEGFRFGDVATVDVDDGFAGIFPADVLVALTGAGAVFLEAVGVAVAVIVDPAEAAFGDRPVAFDLRHVAGGAPQSVEQDEVEGSGIGGAVIRGVGDQFQGREFAAAEFVEDFAGFGVAVGVALMGLPGAEDFEGGAGKVGIEGDGLQADDEGVAAEECHEPGQPGGRDRMGLVAEFDG